jgi:hypothetical protein
VIPNHQANSVILLNKNDQPTKKGTIGIHLDETASKNRIDNSTENATVKITNPSTSNKRDVPTEMFLYNTSSTNKG